MFAELVSSSNVKLLFTTMNNLSDCSSDDSTDEEEMIRDFDKEAQAVINEKIIPT